MAVSVVRAKNIKSDEISWGSLADEHMNILGSEADLGASLAEFLSGAGREAALARSFRGSESLQGWEILSPVTPPCQIICQGKNYLDHLLETGTQPKNKEFNLLFTKADSSLSPPVGYVTRPNHVRLLDYEIELGLVMGKNLSSDFNENNLHEYVAGVVMANDISARDVQIPERQWFKGKSFRGFCPVGPHLVLLEKNDFSYLNNLNLVLKVNGEVRQKANTKLLMHKPADTLKEISKIFDLRVGDLLLTGTPGGVAMRVKSKNWWQEILASQKSEKEKFSDFVEEQAKSSRYLKPGDRVESVIFSDDGQIDLGKQYLTIV